MPKFDARVISIAAALSIAGCSGDDGHDGHEQPPLFDPDGGMVTHGDPKVRLSPTSGLVTTEGGGTASFAVELTEKPRADVKILLHSSNPAEGKPDVNQIVFSPDDWGKKTVTVAGIDDHSIDGSQQFQIILDPTFSDDLDFQGLATGQIYLTNVDDDAAGVTISTTQSTSIAENATVTYDVRLNSRPSAEVRVHLESKDTTRAALSVSDLVFVPTNWDAPQQVTVKAVGNSLDDGDKDVVIAVAPLQSADVSYLGLDPADVKVHVVDDDTAAINVSALQSSEISDSYGSTNFTVSLATQPTSNVTIYVSSNPSGQVKPIAAFTFTPTDYAPRTIPVEAVVDGTIDGDHTVGLSFVVSTSDPTYSGIHLEPLILLVKDGDKPGISAWFETYNRTTYEGSPTICTTGTVTLSSKPKADVFVKAVISKPEEAVSSYTLQFVPGQVSGTAKICGLDDPYPDGDQAYTVKFVVYQTTDTNYAGLESTPLDFKNQDNDYAGVYSSVSGGTTTEAGGTMPLGLRLRGKPTGDVTINLGTSKPAEGLVTPTSITFTPDNYNIMQNVTVTGQDDSVDDGDVWYDVVVTSSQSSDPKFAGLSTILASVKNVDND